MKRPSLGGLARFAIAFVLTGVILWKSEPGKVWQATIGANLGFILAAVALVAVDRALMAYRWLVLLRPLSGTAHLTLGQVMRVFFVSTFVGTFLPASVGGDAVRALMLARHEVPAAGALASVFMDRMLGVLSLLVLAPVCLLFARQLATDPVVLASLAVTLAACALTALIVFSNRVAEMAGWLLDRVPWPRLARLGRSLVDAIKRYATSHRELINVLAGSVGVQLLRITQAYLLGRGLGMAAPFSTYVAFIPLILLVMLLPVTINGLGTSQLAFVWFFGQVGEPASSAFALSILFVALGVVGNLPGGLLYATGGFSGRSRGAGADKTG